jgi:putative intracellular protease/amidase
VRVAGRSPSPGRQARAHNAEEELKKRGALYEKAKLASHTPSVDGDLGTGQNAASAEETATKAAAVLGIGRHRIRLRELATVVGSPLRARRLAVASA